MQSVDTATGEVIEIPHGGLYSPFPIPAYTVLANAGCHKAQCLLTCLVSFLGKSSNEVWPSYTKICERSGLPRGQIKPSLDLLEEFGFVKVLRGRKGERRANNKYRILDAAYDVNKFNFVAKDFMETSYMCKSCGNQLNKGEIRKGPLGEIHLGCGGVTFPRNRKQVRSKSPNKVTITYGLMNVNM